MKIIGLQIENFLNLKAIDMRLDGSKVVLSGKNGAGKTAILDAIQAVLTGKKPEDLIRHGEERAEVVVETEEFMAKRIITNKTDRLEVTSNNGDVKKSPANFLQQVIGKLSFDPLAFSLMKPRDQRDLLKDLVGLNFDDLEKERQKVFDERTVANSRIKESLAQLKNIPAPDPGTPEEESSFKDQVNEVNQLREKREAFLDKVQSKKEVEAKIVSAEEFIKDEEAEILRMQHTIDATKTSIGILKSEIAKIVIPPEVTEHQIMEAQDKLSEIEDLNVKVRAKVRYTNLVKEAEKRKEDADKLTQQLNRIEQDKSTRAANAQYPITGLSINDESVVYNGMIFSQLSRGQQIRVSAAIGMALNPTLRVMFVRDGSLLDSEGKKEISELAKAGDYQLWMELCDESGEVGFFLEDGTIKKVNA